MASSIPFTLEDAQQDRTSTAVLYRIRVSTTPATGPTIRYLTAPRRPGSYSYIPDFRGELLAFATVPGGDWNLGHLGVNDEAKFILASCETAQLDEKIGIRDARPAWHDAKVELIDLLDAFYAGRKIRHDQREANKTGHDNDSEDDDDNRIDIQCVNHVSALILPNPGLAVGDLNKSQPATAAADDIIGVWAWQPGHAHGIAAESDAYSLIQSRDPGLAPRFLGHIVDNKNMRDERVVGFLLKRVDGGKVREAGPGDVDKCREALARLFGVGVMYPRLWRHSFLVREGGDVVLQGFGGAFETADRGVLEARLEELEEVLNGSSELERYNS
ncbi:hypothetical protein C8A05DRAFT_32367 [Staphylotrichum tortipilum]|uniref:Uncharacterized protein n=1 Tax=Staphylotrichum tortipilum TaxID=2831512 RepID=A0AAN6RVD2_9PEZI|nr:hypothetical protein C8A05DRAFT_32367 [Staphylotrichum longicolle]